MVTAARSVGIALALFGTILIYLAAARKCLFLPERCGFKRWCDTVSGRPRIAAGAALGHERRS
jgi:hypothetical protein